MAEWSTAYVNDLPDSSFLYVEPGGEKDDEGKTKPRSMRHFPFKDANGKIDPAHTQNAIARIPQSNAPGLSADKKASLQDKARKLLGIDTQKADEPMATSTVRDTLEKMESLLGITVGVVKMVEMTPVEFCSYAHGEVAKATAEGGAASTRRLKALLTAVTVFKDNYVDGESESVKVPVTVNESTALNEKQNQLMDPLTVGNSNKGGQSAFSQGFVAKIHDLKRLVDSLKAEGADGKLPEDGEETEGLKDEAKAKKAEGDEEETEKAKGKPFPGAAKPFGKPDDEEKAKKADGEDEEKSKAKKVGEDTEEGDDAAGHTTEAGMADKKKTAKVAKGMRGGDVSKDGTAWPADLNDPSFVKDGTVQKSLDWGRD